MPLCSGPLHPCARSASAGIKLWVFAFNAGRRAPEVVQKATRQFANLFEMPVLFYALCLLCVVKGFEDKLQVILAWAYVLLRCVQALIHLSYNHVLHRVVAFALGNSVLLVLWLRVMAQL